METVGDRLAQAQASGDLQAIQAALLDARAAGADPAQIQAALAEVERMERAVRSEPDARAAVAAAQVGIGPVANAPGGGSVSETAAAEEVERLRVRAEALKKRGNERLKDNTKSAAREALECFTAGLEVRCNDRVLTAQLHSNRAHVRILLRQFVEAVDDCRRAIELDPRSLKAYWRAAKASLHLDLCRNAMEFCEAGLQQGPTDADLLKLRDACAERLAALQQRRSAAPQQDFNADEAMQLQDRVNGLNEQMDALKNSMMSKQRERMKAVLTRNSLGETPAEARVYSPVGRCFMVQERAAIEQSLTATIEGLEAELPKLSKTHQELERRKEAAEKELKEMIQAFKKQAERPAVAG